MKNRVKAWLDGFDSTQYAEAVTVTIGDETWEGARYRQHGIEKFYLVGPLPEDWGITESGRTYYTLDGREYCICAYLQDFDSISIALRDYHPFGNNWVMLYLLEGDVAPDADRETPYKRQEMTVT
jgi:hypothetical protein